MVVLAVFWLNGVGKGQAQGQGAAGQATEQQGEGEQEEPNAAERKAEELGVDLAQVEGSGAKERITIDDVTSAANRG